jgi:hypothetical protein
MTRRDVIGVLAGVAAATVLGGCGGSSRHKFRFRMTVEVETPEGLKVGSSVMEMSGASSSLALNGKTVDVNLIGEAVAVDLPGDQTVFMLVTDAPNGGNIMNRIIKTFDPTYPMSERLVALIADLERPSSIRRTAVFVPAQYNTYPQFVRFRNVNDPKSVETVDPDDLEKSFGPGVKLKRVVMTVTDAPVTRTLIKRLPWLVPYPEPSLYDEYSGSMDVRDMPLARRMRNGDFRRGTEK